MSVGIRQSSRALTQRQDAALSIVLLSGLVAAAISFAMQPPPRRKRDRGALNKETTSSPLGNDICSGGSDFECTDVGGRAVVIPYASEDDPVFFDSKLTTADGIDLEKNASIEDAARASPVIASTSFFNEKPMNEAQSIDASVTLESSDSSEWKDCAENISMTEVAPVAEVFSVRDDRNTLGVNGLDANDADIEELRHEEVGKAADEAKVQEEDDVKSMSETEVTTGFAISTNEKGSEVTRNGKTNSKTIRAIEGLAIKENDQGEKEIHIEDAENQASIDDNEDKMPQTSNDIISSTSTSTGKQTVNTASTSGDDDTEAGASQEGDASTDSASYGDFITDTKDVEEHVLSEEASRPEPTERHSFVAVPSSAEDVAQAGNLHETAELEEPPVADEETFISASDANVVSASDISDVKTAPSLANLDTPVATTTSEEVYIQRAVEDPTPTATTANTFELIGISEVEKVDSASLNTEKAVAASEVSSSEASPSLNTGVIVVATATDEDVDTGDKEDATQTADVVTAAPEEVNSHSAAAEATVSKASNELSATMDDISQEAAPIRMSKLVEPAAVESVTFVSSSTKNEVAEPSDSEVETSPSQNSVEASLATTTPEKVRARGTKDASPTQSPPGTGGANVTKTGSIDSPGPSAPAGKPTKPVVRKVVRRISSVNAFKQTLKKPVAADDDFWC